MVLHGFGDASRKACFAVVHVCVEAERGYITNPVALKSQVASLALILIPRQLIAALLVLTSRRPFFRLIVPRFFLGLKGK